MKLARTLQQQLGPKNYCKSINHSALLNLSLANWKCQPPSPAKKETHLDFWQAKKVLLFQSHEFWVSYHSINTVQKKKKKAPSYQVKSHSLLVGILSSSTKHRSTISLHFLLSLCGYTTYPLNIDVHLQPSAKRIRPKLLICYPSKLSPSLFAIRLPKKQNKWK